MQVKAIIALAAFAALASTAVRADEADNAPYGQQIQSSRTRAEVRAEALQEASQHSTLDLSVRGNEPVHSTADVRAVRAQAAQAVRLGQIQIGEAAQF